MTYSSGPQLAVDDQGRAVMGGYVISGHDDYGFRAVAAVPLTEQEAAAGVKHILWNERLGTLLQEVAEQRDLRSQL